MAKATSIRLLQLLATGLLALSPAQAQPADSPSSFVADHCLECHDSLTSKADLNLEPLSHAFEPGSHFDAWLKVYQRVSTGEMPPPDKPQPPEQSKANFLTSLHTHLLEEDQKQVALHGRGTQRRFNRHEYEETLRDLLHLPYLEVKAFLPEDREAHGYNKIGSALDVSHVQIARYLAAADFALRSAYNPATQPPQTTTQRFYTWEEYSFFGAIDLAGPLNRRTFPLIQLDLQTDVMADTNRKMPHTQDPVRRDQEAMAVVVSTYEPTEIRFGSFRAPASGRYRLSFSGYSIHMAADFKSVSEAKRSEPVTIYAETPPRSLRKLGSFDLHPSPTKAEMDVWLLKGETIRPDAARLFRSRPPHHKNPLATPNGMPGVAFQWMEVQGPLITEWPPASHITLFGTDPLPENPAPQHARPLLEAFLNQAYLRPHSPEDLNRFLQVTQKALATGSTFPEALIATYTAVLTSPSFLYLEEQPGPLDDIALAARLSYFLWNSRPDTELLQLARQNLLHQPRILEAQTDRLLKDPRARSFINAFLDYWLDLRLISGTAPDEQLYPDYQLDDHLAESMTEETQLFFQELIQSNLPARNLVQSDFAMLNERLATHYNIPGVDGVTVRKYPLPVNSVRGGLLTQASVLKVTSNGTTTSPVKRGAWIMSRILGMPPPPPPASVPAVDPDIRGATTIRQQLALHRSQESCNACHQKIDPTGFALESFDVMGGYRERYRSVGQGDPVQGIGHNGNHYAFSLAQPVDCSGILWDNRAFTDVRDLKTLLLSDEEQIARNLLQQLTVYATGAPIRFSDQPALQQILADCRASHYGTRSLIQKLVQSQLFRYK